jgi:hypothetical protein
MNTLRYLTLLLLGLTLSSIPWNMYIFASGTAKAAKNDYISILAFSLLPSILIALVLFVESVNKKGNVICVLLCPILVNLYFTFLVFQ